MRVSLHCRGETWLRMNLRLFNLCGNYLGSPSGLKQNQLITKVARTTRLPINENLLVISRGACDN